MIEQTGPPLSLTITLLCFCIIFLLIIGVAVLGFIARRNPNPDKEDKL